MSRKNNKKRSAVCFYKKYDHIDEQEASEELPKDYFSCYKSVAFVERGNGVPALQTSGTNCCSKSVTLTSQVRWSS